MKKYYAIILFALLAVLAACSNETKQPEEPKPYEQEITAIFELAKEGKVPGAEVTAGSKQTSVSEQINADTTENGRIYKLKSRNNKELFTQNDIEEALGAADDTANAEEGKVLVYEVNEQYRLEFTVLDEESSAVSITVFHKPSEQIVKQIQSMSLEEKIGQLLMMGVEGTSLDETARIFIEERHVGGVI